MLHVICTRLRPGHLSVCVGDSSRRSEGNIKKNPRIASVSAIIVIVTVTWSQGKQQQQQQQQLQQHPKNKKETSRLDGLVVKASTSGAEDPGIESRLRRDFSGSNHTSDLKIIGSALGLVSPVSVYCD